MIDQSELTNLGKGIAQDYLSNGISLSEGLQKVANQKSLSKPQIDRVAETANVETYLQLMKKAEDKYIKFDLADPKSISTQTKKASTDWVNDYEHAPKYQFDVNRLFSDIPEDEQIDDSAGRLKHAQNLKGTISFINNRLDESCANVESGITSLFNQVKQAHLSGTPIDHIYTVVKQASPETFDYIWTHLEDKLDATGIKVASSIESLDKTVNPNSKLFKASQQTEMAIFKTAALNYAREHYIEEYQDTPLYDKSHNLIKESGVFGGLLKFIKNHPILSSATALGTAAFSSGKKRGKRMQGEILQKAIVDTKPNKRTLY